jgi:hypothetical protein
MTFLSHQALVLPLKIAAPRWTSGTALVLGSMAPDVEYFLRGYPTSTISHTWVGQLVFCLPVTVALYWVVTRIVAEPAAAHLPDGGALRLRDFALLRQQPAGARHWGIVASSAVIGSSSHVVLDRLVAAAGGMPYHSLAASRAWVAANVALWFVLAAVTLLLLRHIGQNRLLQRWADARASAASGGGHEVEARPARRARPLEPRQAPSNVTAFWSWVLFGMAVGAALGIYYRRLGFWLDGLAAWVHIWLCSISGAFVALVLMCAAWHVARGRAVHLRDQAQ